MPLSSFFTKFIAVIGGVWMLALAYKMVGDTWDALFSKKYKKWLSTFTKKGKTELVKTSKKIIKVTKNNRSSIIFPIKKEKEPKNKGVKRGDKRVENKRNKGNNRN